MIVNLKKKHRSFKGFTKFYSHNSVVTGTEMNFSTYEPDNKIENAIIWLSGLTCNEENFITKAGVQPLLSDTNTMIICPDTSPRGLNLEGEHESYDFGSGAGFYLNATTPGYKDHYKMYDYISVEIVQILKASFNIKKISIMGHSMGGHGALVLSLNEKELFTSVSAFSPIVNPTKCPWGQKAFSGYLENPETEGGRYDATLLVKSGHNRSDTILIDQGLDDEFLEKELLSDNFIQACDKVDQSLKLNFRKDFDHSYYFIASFLPDHINHHLSLLNK